MIPYIQTIGNGEWPWLSAILLKNQYGLQFHCSGTLISNKHIITGLKKKFCIDFEFFKYKTQFLSCT